ncbi:hypothetical protein D3C72_2084760 [compost metagenome]
MVAQAANKAAKASTAAWRCWRRRISTVSAMAISSGSAWQVTLSPAGRQASSACGTSASPMPLAAQLIIAW